MRIAFGAFLALCLLADRASADESVDYVRDIAPIFDAHCRMCHGHREQEAGLRLDHVSKVMAGGDNGRIVVAGKSAESRLIQSVLGTIDDSERMPLDEDPLTPKQIALLKRWIDEGAKVPEDSGDPAPAIGDSDHWSFQPIKRWQPPVVENQAWVRNAIDRFILSRLENEGIGPSPQAERATLIRRVSLDLIGMPPTPEEVDRFVGDRRPDAWQRVVERLLASPRFGERWGRHWLDLARYADSNGYTIDGPRDIWKYRDWVIQAINRDLPFDQFVIEQIAGDLLPDATEDQRIATGFHRNTMFNQEGGTDQEQFRVERTVDRVNTTGGVFLGISIGCGQCHSHKFDPFSQREYYQLFAFFNSVDEPTLEFPTPEQTQQRDQIRAELAELNKQLKAHDRAVAEKQEGVAEKQEGENTDAARKEIVARIDKLKKSGPKVRTTMVMRERATARDTHLFIRGDFLRKGPLVSPGVPAVLPPLPEKKQYNRVDLARWLVSPENPLTPRVTVNRVWQQLFGVGIVPTENDFGTQGAPPTHPKLLDWLAGEFVGGDRLTATQRGARDQGPTSPPNALAAGSRLNEGWSMKQLLRLIVNSATYRQSSSVRPELVDLDPRNELIARQSRIRLEAEVIRDSALVVSSLLSDKIGGPSVFPYQAPGVMELAQVNRPWKVSPGQERYRRGMYTYFWRSTPHPLLKLFDAPEAQLTCTQRNRSNTPLQALTLLNDVSLLEFSRGLAGRVLSQAEPDDAGRARYAFRLCMGRDPGGLEESLLSSLIEQQRAEFNNDPAGAQEFAGTDLPEGVGPAEMAAWTAVARVLLNTDEFITRE